MESTPTKTSIPTPPPPPPREFWEKDLTLPVTQEPGMVKKVEEKVLAATDSALASASAAASTIGAAGAAAGHGIAERAHVAQEAVDRNLATSSSVSASTRMESAKAALQHHQAAQVHAAQKEELVESSGLSTLGHKTAAAISAIPTVLATGVSYVASGAASAYHSAESAVAHMMEKKETAATPTPTSVSAESDRTAQDAAMSQIGAEQSINTKTA